MNTYECKYPVSILRSRTACQEFYGHVIIEMTKARRDKASCLKLPSSNTSSAPSQAHPPSQSISNSPRNPPTLIAISNHSRWIPSSPSTRSPCSRRSITRKTRWSYTNRASPVCPFDSPCLRSLTYVQCLFCNLWELLEL